MYININVLVTPFYLIIIRAQALVRGIHSDLDDDCNGAPESLSIIPVASKKSLETLIMGHVQALVTAVDQDHDCPSIILSDWCKC